MENREYINVKLEQLKPFSGILYDESDKGVNIKGNSFYVPDDYLTQNDKDSESIRRLHASIKQEGVLVPILVRHSKEENKYEVLSGYRRKRVCEELAKTDPKFSEIPVIVVDCDDDTANSIITSSNVQRKEISLLDTIKSCGRMYRAMRHRGKKNGEEFTLDVVSQITGLKPRTISRYSQLLELPEEMLQLVGNKAKTQKGELRLSIRAGEVLAALSQKQLKVINGVLKDSSKTVSFAQALSLKTLCKNRTKITTDDVEQITAVEKPKKVLPIKKRKISFDEEKLRMYCPDMTDEQIAELVYEFFEQRSKASANP